MPDVALVLCLQEFAVHFHISFVCSASNDNAVETTLVAATVAVMLLRRCPR